MTWCCMEGPGEKRGVGRGKGDKNREERWREGRGKVLGYRQVRTRGEKRERWREEGGKVLGYRQVRKRKKQWMEVQEEKCREQGDKPLWHGDKERKNQTMEVRKTEKGGKGCNVGR